jgi:3-oxoacyl-[acyl-carrier protein] reductase
VDHGLQIRTVGHGAYLLLAAVSFVAHGLRRPPPSPAPSPTSRHISRNRSKALQTHRPLRHAAGKTRRRLDIMVGSPGVRSYSGDKAQSKGQFPAWSDEMTADPQDFVLRAHRSRGKWASDLEGKVAIVTGAGRLRSIGRMIALELARNGVNVAVTGTGRDPSTYPTDEIAVGWKDIESVSREIEQIGPRCVPVVANVASDSDVAELVDRVTTSFGRIDILINNAGAARGEDRRPVVELEPDVWRHVIDVNVNGTFLLSRAVAQSMIAQGDGGRIINISSIAAVIAGASAAAYSSSKAAIDALSHAMALELAPHAITVNSIRPGVVETARMDDLGREERWEEWVREMIPLGWASDGMDIAYMATFLCSSMGAWVTGQSINVDGGRVWR